MNTINPRKHAEDLPPALDLISDYLAYGAITFPQRDALITDGEVKTYAAANSAVNTIARALMACGVNKGDRVATLLPPCSLYFEIFLAVASIGAIWVGLNPKYSKRELEHPINDSSPSLIFAYTEIADRKYDADLRHIVENSGAGSLLIDLSDNAAAEGFTSQRNFLKRKDETSVDDLHSRRMETNAQDPCLIVYTSGTTGAPKGAMITHYGLVYCSRTDAAYNTFSDGQRILCNFPINHIACVGDVCCTTLVVGGAIIFMKDFNPLGVAETIEREQLTHLGQIPAMLQMEIPHLDNEKFDLSSLKHIAWGGNPASIDLVMRLRRKCPDLANVYGMTETTGNVIFARGPDVTDEQLANSVGWAPREYEVGIYDEDGAETPPGEIGEIRVRGPYLMKGYWRNDVATKEAITSDGWLKTGDLAKRREDGAISIVGRRSQMFKSGGYNIYPAEIEQAIESHSSVAMAAVVGIPDSLYFEVGHAFIISNTERLTEDLLRKFCRTILANYKIPKRFSLVKELPMLPNGKVDKRRLMELAQER